MRPFSWFDRPRGALLAATLLIAACGGGDGNGEGGAAPGRGGGSGGASPWAGMAGGQVAAVPVEIAPVERRDISSYIETNGTLEAENEVDVVARLSAPIVELRAEEGMKASKGQVLARLDDAEIRAQLEVNRVTLDEATLAYERAQRLQGEQLMSPEAFEQIEGRYQTAKAQLEGTEIQLGYTTIRAPFAGHIVARYVDNGQQVSPNTPLFRISDFDPLLCPIRVPERELPKLELGQDAYLTVEAWRGERFAARVLRISPVVDAATGTVKVTLEVDAAGKLRPGMFSRVYLEVDRRRDVLVVPKSALSLESIGDTVYVAEEGLAARREVTLGFQEGDSVQIVSGVDPDDAVIVVGQDGLSDGTPVRVLGEEGATAAQASGAPGNAPGGAPAGAEGAPAAGAPGAGGPGFDISKMTPEQLEGLKERMRARGMTDEQIEERLEAMRKRMEGGG